MVSPGGVTSPRRSRRLAGLSPAECPEGRTLECDQECNQELGEAISSQGLTVTNSTEPHCVNSTSNVEQARQPHECYLSTGMMSSGSRGRDRSRKRRKSIYQRQGCSTSSNSTPSGSGWGSGFDVGHLSNESRFATIQPWQSGPSQRSDLQQPSTSGALSDQVSLSSSFDPPSHPDSSEDVAEPGSSGTTSSTSRTCVTPSFLGCGYRGLASSIAVPVKGESFCDCPKKGRDLQCTCGEEDNAPIEWCWDPESKSAATELSADGRDVKFHVNYSSGTAAARGTQSMMDSQYFWEIKMTTPVYGTDMMVGVGTPDVDMNSYRHKFCSMLGRDGDSWGLSYLGRIHHKGRSQLYAPCFGQGTIIGVHLDMWHGTVAFYKNRKPLGIAYSGLNGKVLHPMVSSTAARSGMRIIKACSFCTSLQFMCCQVLRRTIPSKLGVIEALENLPPGLKAFLTNNLGWLLRSSELERDGSLSDFDASDSELSDRGSERACHRERPRKKCGGSQTCKGRCRFRSYRDAYGSGDKLGKVDSETDVQLPSGSISSSACSTSQNSDDICVSGCSMTQPGPSDDVVDTNTDTKGELPTIPHALTSGTDGSTSTIPRTDSLADGQEGARRVRKRPFPSSEAKASGTSDSLQEIKRKKS